MTTRKQQEKHFLLDLKTFYDMYIFHPKSLQYFTNPHNEK